MMIFLFKKKKVEFLGSFRNHRRFIFCPMFTYRLTAQLVFRDVGTPDIHGGGNLSKAPGG